MPKSPELATDVHVVDDKGARVVLTAGTPKSKIPTELRKQVGDHCYETETPAEALVAGPGQSAVNVSQLSEEDLAYIREARQAEAERREAEQEAADKAAAEAAEAAKLAAQGGGQS